MTLPGEFQLCNRNSEVVGVTVCDLDDVPVVSEFTWSLSVQGYAVTRVDGRVVKMHQVILGTWFDHIDRDKLNNRRCNLRPCTPQTNAHNMPARGGSSSYRGVTYDKQTGRWKAQVGLGGKNHHIGRFATEEEAADAALRFRLSKMEYAHD